MRNFLAALALALTLFALDNVALAYTTVQLCDRNVESVISDLSKTVKNFGVTLWGKEYYTYKGERRCQLRKRL